MSGRDALVPLLKHYYRKQELIVLSRGDGGYDLPHTWLTEAGGYMMLWRNGV
jgi:hypothetical protein